MTGSLNNFHLSDAEDTLARQLASASFSRSVTINNLVLDDYSSYWHEMVRVAHAHLGNGQNETIAIVDSGFSRTICGTQTIDAIDESKCIDLTDEKRTEPYGHGAAISALIHLIAPAARQYHIRIFNSTGRIPGTYEDGVALTKKAFEHIERVGASIVNLSWNYLTTMQTHAPRNVRPDHYCSCPICEIVTSYVKRTNVDVFVSEGNFTYDPKKRSDGIRTTGDWLCPASATFAVPVLACRDGVSQFNTNLDASCAIPAPGEIRLPAQTGLWSRLWRWLSGNREPESITGSSFSTPLAVATYAALRSAFRSCRYENLTIPRNCDREEAGMTATSYDFPLDLFFRPPNAPASGDQALHTEWTVLHHNCMAKAKHLHKNGENENAGVLCCLLADLMSVAYRRMGEWNFNVNIGAMILELYLSGIEFLLQTELGIITFDYTQKARATVTLLNERRSPLPPRGKERLAELEEAQKRYVQSFVHKI